MSEMDVTLDFELKFNVLYHTFVSFEQHFLIQSETEKTNRNWA